VGPLEIRPAVMRRLAERAGFGSVEILPIEHPFWRFYHRSRAPGGSVIVMEERVAENVLPDASATPGAPRSSRRRQGVAGQHDGGVAVV